MNANLCSAAIWPEMGASAALTTGSEAESISAHFLDHLLCNSDNVLVYLASLLTFH